MKKIILLILILVSSSAFAQMSDFDCFKKVYSEVPELQRIDQILRNDTYEKNYLTYNVVHSPSIFNNFKKVYLEVVFKSGLTFKPEYEYLKYWAVNPNTGALYSWNPETYVLTDIETWKYLNNSH